MTIIYHLTTEREFFQQIESEDYAPSGFETEGFIHFSQEHQILGVANKYYHNAESPILLEVAVEKLKAPLKYEAPIHPGGAPSTEEGARADLFPHLYGKINKTAIVNIIPMRRDSDGNYTRVW